MTTTLIDYCVTLSHIPMTEIEGRVEVRIVTRPAAPTWTDPGHGVEVELGAIERQVRRSSLLGGSQNDYEAFPDDDLGRAMERAIRSALEADDAFVERVADWAFDADDDERADAQERKRDADRDDRMMEELHNERV